jgi:lipoprotein NlpI
MEKIVQFYLGIIDADSIEAIMTIASQKLQRQSYLNSHYFYLGLAYLYNLKPGFVLTSEYRDKAIKHLKYYVTKAIKDDVEFSMARMEINLLTQN